MSASYPTSVKVFTTKNTNDVIQPAHINDAQDEISSIETVLSNSLVVSANAAVGYKFPAVQNASTDVNTLDDYEEGTWTPAITSAGGGAATYSVQVGRYVKIGKLVRVNGRVTLATKGTLAAGAVTITGLPFASDSTTNADAAAIIGQYSLTTAIVSIFASIAANTSAIALQINTVAATSGTNLLVTDVAATSTFVFSASYMSQS